MQWKKSLAKSFVQSSLALAVVCCACAQSFAGIIVTPVLRSQTYNAGVANVVVDVYGQGSPGAQTVGAFGLSVALSGPGTITGYSATAPTAVVVDFLSPLNSFRELNSGAAGVNGAVVSGTTVTFTRAGFLAPGTPASPNVTIASTALPAAGAPQESARLIGTISFTTNANGVFTFTPTNATVNFPSGGSGSGFFVSDAQGAFTAITGNTLSPVGINITAVPEPSSIALLAVAGIGMGTFIRRRMKKNAA
jgi:hypothetical protein